MKVTLAYPYDGHKADDKVDLPEDVAKQLVRDGRARVESSKSTGKKEA